MAKSRFCPDGAAHAQLSTRVPPAVHRALKLAGARRNETMSDIVCEALCSELGIDPSGLFKDGDHERGER